MNSIHPSINAEGCLVTDSANLQIEPRYHERDLYHVDTKCSTIKGYFTHSKIAKKLCSSFTKFETPLTKIAPFFV